MNFRLKIPLFLGLLGFFCLILPNTARADSFDWTYQGTMLLSGVLSSGGGELTTTNGVITDLSGTFNGLTIASLVPPGGLFGNDNLLLLPPGPLYVTPNGFSFLDSVGDQINIYASLGGTQCTCGPSGCICVPYNIYASVSDDGNSDFGNFSLTPVMATPEPATTTMLLVAVLGFGLLLACRRFWNTARLVH